MKLWLLVIICLPAISAFSQDKPVVGLVFDKTTKERIAKVSVRNLRNGESIYNTLKADFKIPAQPGDALVFSKLGYFTDTIKVPKTGDIAVYLKASSIMLQQVNVRDTFLTAQKRLEQAHKDYSKVYGTLNNHDLLSVLPGAGAGISIDAIWNLLSRSGRNAAHLREIIDRDYKLNVIDQRFTKTLVQKVTGLKEPQLTSFMTRYRPSYYLVSTATDYEFITYIKGNLKRFLRYPKTTAASPFQSNDE